MKGFIFFETWFQAIEGWPDAADRAEAYAVLAQYALTGEEVESVSAFARAMLTMAKANIDKSAEIYNARSEAGRKGMSQRWSNNKRNDDATTVTQRNGDATPQRCNDDTTMQRDVTQRNGDATPQRCNDDTTMQRVLTQRNGDATPRRCTITYMLCDDATISNAYQNDNKSITNDENATNRAYQIDNKSITNDENATNRAYQIDNKSITNGENAISNAYQTITDKDKDKDMDKDMDDLTPLTPLRGGDARERASACVREGDDDAAMQRCNDDATAIQRNNDASLHDVTMQRNADATTVTQRDADATSLQRHDTTTVTLQRNDATSQRYNDTTTVMQRDVTQQRNDNNTPPPSTPTPTPPRKKFTKPTLDELQQFMHQYAEEHHTTRGAEQAQRFIDYYESNGWKVGRNPMKSWQAAARNWLNRQDATTTTYNTAPLTPTTPTPYSERDRGTFNEFTPTPNLAHDDRTPEQIQAQRQTPEEKAAILERLREKDKINSQRIAQLRQADNIRATQRQQQKKTMYFDEFKARQQQQTADGTHAPSDFPVHMSKQIPGNNKQPPFQNVPRGTPLSDEEYEQVKQNKINAYLKQKAQQDTQDNNTNNS